MFPFLPKCSEKRNKRNGTSSRAHYGKGTMFRSFFRSVLPSFRSDLLFRFGASHDLSSHRVPDGNGKREVGNGKSDMSILALDPGTIQTGWALYCAGEVLGSGIEPNEKMLAMLLEPQHRETVLTIEMIASYGMAVGREVFEACVWIGRFQQAWHDPDAVKLVYRRIVKMHLCESVKAKDTNVWQALVDKFGAPGTKSAPGKLYGVRSHARAALALAVTVAEASC